MHGTSVILIRNIFREATQANEEPRVLLMKKPPDRIQRPSQTGGKFLCEEKTFRPSDLLWGSSTWELQGARHRVGVPTDLMSRWWVHSMWRQGRKGRMTIVKLSLLRFNDSFLCSYKCILFITRPHHLTLFDTILIWCYLWNVTIIIIKQAPSIIGELLLPLEVTGPLPTSGEI